MLCISNAKIPGRCTASGARDYSHYKGSMHYLVLRHLVWCAPDCWNWVAMVTSKILSERAQVCPLSKFTTKADPKTLKEDSETPNPEPTASSCYCWLESTIRMRGFSRRNMKSRLTFAREKEEKDQDFWNNDVWTNYFKSELSEHQTKFSIPGKDPRTNSEPWSWKKNH